MSDPLADPGSIHWQLLQIMAGPEAADPTTFRRAAELGVFPTVRQWLKNRGDDVSASDPGARRHQVAHALRRRALDEILDAVDSPFVVLKGLPLARELYADPSRRQSGDIDLLTRRSDLDSMRHELEQIGYRATSPIDSDANRELELVHEDTGLLIDLHWRIAFPWVPSPSTTKLISSRTAVRIAGRSIPVLSRPNRLVNLFLHFHDHVGFVKGLLDIAAFLDVHGPESLDEAMPVLDECGLIGVASWPLEVFKRLAITAPEPPAHRRSTSLLAGWTARPLPLLLRHHEEIGARHPSSFKLGTITNGEQVAMKAATMTLLDRRRDRIRAMVRPVASSPSALARRSGRQAPAPQDWLRWALRPAELVARQFRQMTDD